MAIWDDIWGGAKKVGETVGDAASAVGGAVVDAGEAVGGGVIDAGAAVGGAAGDALGFIEDKFLGGDERNEARRQQENQKKYWDLLEDRVPASFGNMDYNPVTVAKPDPLDAAVAEAHEMGPSAFDDAAADQTAIDAQREALERFGSIAEQGGLTAIDRARMAESQREQEQFLSSQRGANMADMQARGMAGSGTELAQQESAMQSAAQRRSMDDMRTQALAQQRAFDATGAQGDLAGSMRDQSWSEVSDRARAMDAINKYNTDNRQNTEEANTAREQDATLTDAKRKDMRTYYHADEKARSRDMRNKALQDELGFHERITSGRTGQYQGDPQGAARNQGKILRDSVSGAADAIGSLYNNEGKGGGK